MVGPGQRWEPVASFWRFMWVPGILYLSQPQLPFPGAEAGSRIGNGVPYEWHASGEGGGFACYTTMPAPWPFMM